MAVDAIGREISPGDIIIYNLSGDLAVGKVTRITQAKQYGRSYNKIEAQILKSVRSTGKSIIKNTNSIIVVDKKP